MLGGAVFAAASFHPESMELTSLSVNTHEVLLGVRCVSANEVLQVCEKAWLCSNIQVNSRQTSKRLSITRLIYSKLSWIASHPRQAPAPVSLGLD